MIDETPHSIEMKFIDYVNEKEYEGLESLILGDLLFTDIRGRRYQEREFMTNYCVDYPKFNIHVYHVLQSGSSVALIGRTTGSHVPPQVEEKKISDWTAELLDGLIQKWRVYSEDRFSAGS